MGTEIEKLAVQKTRIICKANCKYNQNYDRICTAPKLLLVQTDPDTPKLVCTYYQPSPIAAADIAQSEALEPNISSAVTSDVQNARQKIINKHLMDVD